MTREEWIVVYDPNAQNPYGSEVSRVLASFGPEVHLYCADGRKLGDIPGVSLFSVLDARGTQSMLVRAWKRLVGPIQTVCDAGRGKPLVVVWTSGTWDAVLFAVRALFFRGTFFIHHNPTQARGRRGLSGLAVKFLARVATECRHSLEADERIRTVVHPSFAHLARLLPPVVGESRSRGGRRLGFVGNLRADKGPMDLAAIVERIAGTCTLVIASSESVPDSLVSACATRGVVLEQHYGRRLDDSEFVALVASCDLVLAPYREVTESSSVVLAQTLGVPTIAYESAAMSRRLTPRSLAGGPGELAHLANQYLEEPWDTYLAAPPALDLACRESWEPLLSPFFHEVNDE
jgi:hypothetical protein